MSAVRIKEPFNAVSHAIGAVLATGGLGYLLWAAQGNNVALAAFSVYGAMAIALFVVSAAYHWSKRWEDLLQRLDYTAIYLMIAGTYTPVCLLGLAGPMGRGIVALQWSLAAIGIVTTFAWPKAPDWVRVVLYLVMGWMALPLIGPLTASLGSAGVALVVAGGLAYTLGTVIYATGRPDPWPDRFGSHGIWHLFVLAGAALHFGTMVLLARSM